MVPKLLQVDTLILASSIQDYPREIAVNEILREGSPVYPWRRLFAGRPTGVQMGVNRKQTMRPGYTRIFFDVYGDSEEFSSLTDEGDVSIAIVQIRSIVSGYVSRGNIVGADLKYEQDSRLRGIISLDLSRIKQLLDFAV
jgi:hypothetical protein